MDLKKLDTVSAANAGAVMQVTHPGTGDDIKGMTITLMGMDSDVYRKEIKKRAEKSLNSRNKREKVDLDEAEKKGAELLAKLTLSWTGFEEGKDKLECTPANAQRIFLEYRWLRDQAEQFISERANFLKA